MDVRIEGAEKLGKLAQLLKTEAPKELNRALTRAVSNATGPMKRAILDSTEDFLPRRGGLASRVAKSRLRHRVRKGRNPKVTIAAAKNSHTLRDPYRVDRGRIAHPVFGMAHSRNPWQLQDVRPGWFTQPAEDNADIPRRELMKQVDGLIELIERRIP